MEGWKSQGRYSECTSTRGAGGRFLNGPVKGLRQPLPGAGLPGAGGPAIDYWVAISNGNTATSHLWPRGQFADWSEDEADR